MLRYVLVAVAILLPVHSFAAIEYDQNVTPEVIFGAGNANGGFTTDRANGLELGLRAKTRFPIPLNQFNSNGDGTYTHPAENDAGRPLWSFEWSINTSWNGSKNLRFLRDLIYELRIDTDPSASTSFFAFDPINDPNPDTGFWDHAIGDQFTGNGGGQVATSQAIYDGAIEEKHVAQNSWRMDFFPVVFNPNIGGIYTFELLAYPKDSITAPPIAATSIDVIVEVENGAVPEPLSFLTWGGLIGCVFGAARRWRLS